MGPETDASAAKDDGETTGKADVPATTDTGVPETGRKKASDEASPADQAIAPSDDEVIAPGETTAGDAGLSPADGTTTGEPTPDDATTSNGAPAATEAEAPADEAAVDAIDPSSAPATSRAAPDEVAGAASGSEADADPRAPGTAAPSGEAASGREEARPADGATAAAPTPQPQIAEKRGPGFLPLVLGGLVAGAIGYAVPTFLLQDEPPSEVVPPVVDDSRIAAVEAEIAELSARPASTAVIDESDLEAIRSAQNDLTDRLGAFDARIEDLEAQPLTAEAMEALRAQVETLGSDVESFRADLADRIDTLSGDVDTLSGNFESLSGEFESLSGEFETLRGDLGPRLDSVESRLSEVSARADDVEADAEAQAREAARNQIAIALESGAAYAEPLAVLGPAPWALFDAADNGVATLDELRSDFPALAREALRVARAAETEPGVASLFRNAFNARSLEPREGDDPDAVLSRAEAAVRAGDLEAALDEIAALPEDARAVLSEWTRRARTRAEAVAAADEFLKDG